jgi:hypothetical protein
MTHARKRALLLLTSEIPIQGRARACPTLRSRAVFCFVLAAPLTVTIIAADGRSRSARIEVEAGHGLRMM